MPLLPVLSPAQSAAWDARAERAGIALGTLMESAGRAAATVLLREFPHAARQGVLVAAGTGHNGGDGWVLARALHRLDVPVWVASLAGERRRRSRHMLPRSRAPRVCARWRPTDRGPSLGLLVDAILGTGASGAPRAPAAALLERMLDLDLPVLAIDGPTGLDLGTGVVHGVTRADVTVTFGGFRRGHLLARDEVGDLVVVDIGHPPAESGAPLFVTDAFAAARLPPLHASDHKGERGRVVVIGGDAGMSGAARLAGRAAFAAGAGLVHVVSAADTIAAVRAAEPDLQTLVHPLSGDVGDELRRAAGARRRRRDRARARPRRGEGGVRAGVRRAREARRDRCRCAGGAAGQGAGPRRARVRSGRIVLTPHAGEFRTLFPALASERDTDPWGAAAHAAEQCGATVLLKGVPTAIARAGRPLLTVAAGNPGLATGGSGDVLSGILGAFLARDVEPEVAAAVAAQALGRAADLAARRVTARGDATDGRDRGAARPLARVGRDAPHRGGGRRAGPAAPAQAETGVSA